MEHPILEIERLVAGGDGLARAEDGRVVFVSGSVPGDQVRVRFTKQAKDFAKAEIVDLLTPGASRVAPPCRFVDAGCGGCGWQHIDVDAARRFKRDLLIESARRIGKFDVDIDAVALPGAAFRTTVRMAVSDGTLGFRAARSHDVVPVDQCMAAHPLIADLAGSARVSGADEVTLRASPSSGTRLAILHGDGQPALTGVPSDVRVVSRAELAAGSDAALVHHVAGHNLQVSARSFFQSRHDGTEALVELVRTALDGAAAGTFVDLYGGVGLFAATCADDRPIVLVESNPSSTADATVNLASRSAEVVVADVERWNPTPAAVVVADPPRAGLGKAGIEAVCATGAADVVLVSCDAASFARDVGGLRAAGFEVVTSTFLDVFGSTAHVEVVTRLRQD